VSGTAWEAGGAVPAGTVPRMSGGAEAETRRFGRSAGLLASGVGLAGLLTYVYFSLASHNLDKAEYGEVVVLWSATFVTISVLYRPVEQLLSRTIAERETQGLEIGRPLRVAALIQGSIAIVCAAAAIALRGPLQDDLLSGSETLYWIFVAAIVAFAASFYARGFLAGRRRFAILAGLLLAESASRMLFAFAVAVGIASGQAAVALGVAAAPCLSLLVVPLAFGRRAATVALPPPSATRGSGFTLARGGGFAAAVFLVMLSEQTLLNAGPLLVKGTAGAAAAGYIFNVLMVARAPLLLFQGVSTSLLPHLTRLQARGREGGDAFRLSVRVTVGAIAGFTGAVVLIVLAAGPALMQLAFSDKFSYDRAGLLLVALGMGLYLVATTLNQAAVAQGQVRRAAACWVMCAAGFLVWNLTDALSDFRRVEVGFAVAALALAMLLFGVYRRPRARHEDIVQPGSPAELEARLAAAEEIG
jgi:O-antigen/teichoic acid export membrane protein